MPGTMDGVQLAHHVRQTWPSIKVIVISGKVGLADVDLPQDVLFLSKPYQEAHLHGTINKLTSR
jgi:hypothetical protein